MTEPNIARQGLYVGGWYLAEFRGQTQLMCVRYGGDFTADSIVGYVYDNQRDMVECLIIVHNKEVKRMAEALTALKQLAVTKIDPLPNAQVATLAMRGLQEMR